MALVVCERCGRDQATPDTSGTSKVPLVTVKAVETPVPVTQFPVPLKVPMARVDEIVVKVIVPDDRKHVCVGWKVVLFA